MKPLPQAIIKEAKRLMMGGVSTRETARRLGISPASASRIYSDCDENMPVNKGGRPRKIPAETVEYLKVNMKRGTLKTAVEARKEANQILPNAVSVSTIRRRLREAGLASKRRVKQPTLKRVHVKGRKIHGMDRGRLIKS
ncbi:hypothetical protein BGZ51_001649 [Haplosporangium sp. Z 767]|nr:hypothetical protein BGZ50_003737 [Haplosporangium sp. Z 11]KAF9193956.1 hypothetical protein BGZ51_001649 [Haplosporangium sp. Z 767]